MEAISAIFEGIGVAFIVVGSWMLLAYFIRQPLQEELDALKKDIELQRSGHGITHMFEEQKQRLEVYRLRQELRKHEDSPHPAKTKADAPVRR